MIQRNSYLHQGQKLRDKLVQNEVKLSKPRYQYQCIYTKIGHIVSFCSQAIERKLNSDINDTCHDYYKFVKLTCNNPNLAFFKFGQILSIWPQDNERKLNSDICQRPHQDNMSV